MKQAMRNIALTTLALVLVGSAVSAQEAGSARAMGSAIEWSLGSAERATVTISHPDGKVTRHEFAAGETPRIEAILRSGKGLADGVYRFEVVGAAKARTRGQAAEAAGAGQGGFVRSGSFRVAGGEISLPIAGSGARSDAAGAREDQVIPDDLIVQGSGCFGFDCVNNESFGFDTIRLKENNLRIKFEDTSTGTFPTNDWQLTANDSASGGASKFSIEDITGSKVPFTVTAGAATNSLFIDSTGRMGLRTSTPVLDLHINTSNTPAIRLEQNNSGGFTAQTWDIGANEANFFVRDVTGGSKLSFRIRPGAPTSSIDISSDGDVGIGTGSPDAKLHVAMSTATGRVFIQNTNGTAVAREMLNVTNNGAPLIIYKDTTATQWSSGPVGGSFLLDDQADGQQEFVLTTAGNLTVSGTLTPNSSRTVKQDFETVDTQSILGRVVSMPITSWKYKAEADSNVRHIGPMAEDFFENFAVGADAKGISVTDSAGVAFAAIQGLYQEVQSKNAALEARNAELEARLAKLEAMIQSLAVQQP
jgi:hypothetical protein